MLAIDTNVVVRYLTGDNPKQAAQARTLIDGNDIFVTVTVLLETEWVLRSVFGYPAVTVAKGLRSFGGLPNVTIEGAPIVAQALDWFEGGMDFADALHLAQASGCEAFVSFDRRLVRLAKALKGPPARLP
jgi:predicted nucleic-acid-binding protein